MATTALQGLPYPVGSDTPAGHTQVLALANAVEKKANMTFASAAARTSAFTAASVTPTEGMECWLNDTNAHEFYDGTRWVRHGTLGYAEATANQGSITTLVDLTSLSVAVTCGSSRRIRITGFLPRVQSTVLDDLIRLYIREGSTTLETATVPARNTGLGSNSIHIAKPILPTGGAHTYKLSLERTSGSGTVTTVGAATEPMWILVEDIGV